MFQVNNRGILWSLFHRELNSHIDVESEENRIFWC